MRKADYDLYADNIEVKPNHVEAMCEIEREERDGDKTNARRN